VTFAPYTYAYNDPVNLTDPNGDIATILLGALIGGVAGLGSGLVDYFSHANNPDESLWGDLVGGAVGGAIGGACIGAAFWLAVGCGAVGSGVTDLIKGASGEKVTICQGIRDVATGGFAGALGGKIIPFNKGWKLPTRISNIWNPGTIAKGIYAGGLLGTDAGVLSSDVVSCLCS
jgi:hypothetical protein